MELDQEKVTLPDICELQKKLEECISKCQEWEDRARKAEERCIKLESYIPVENETNIEIEMSERSDRALVGTVRVEEDDAPVQTRENNLEEQITLVQNKNGVTIEEQCGLQETVLNEEDIVTQLMIENSVLNYEKKKAESEVELLKIKHRELKCRYERLLIGKHDAFAGSTTRKYQKNMETHENFHDVDGQKVLQAEETPSIRTPSQHPRNVKERNRSMLSETQRSHRGQVKKQLKYGEDGHCKNLAPLTPSVVKPTLYSIIDISENEDEPNVSNGVDVPDESDEDSSGENEISLVRRTPRKRKAFNVVYSDGEDGDDNISKSKSRFNNSEKQSDDVEDSGLNGDSSMSTSNSEDELRKQTQKRRRHLVSLSNQNRKDGPEISLNEASEEQEEESTTRSIDDNTDTSSIRSYSTESREASDDDDVEESKSNYEWQFEGEMLAAFGKDVDMCMRAVCALYRQQTTDEKTSKETIYHNGRGFSQCDASRGTSLAEFLTGGDPAGDLTKTVEELEGFNADAPELCQTLAFNYSNQLFRIYKNKEDPFFLPS